MFRIVVIPPLLFISACGVGVEERARERGGRAADATTEGRQDDGWSTEHITGVETTATISTDEPTATSTGADEEESTFSGPSTDTETTTPVATDTGPDTTTSTTTSSGSETATSTDSGLNPPHAARLVSTFLTGGDGPDEIVGIVEDPNGNTFVAGAFAGEIRLDPEASAPTFTTSPASSQIFVAKYDYRGAFLWAARLGSDSSLAHATGLALASSGQFAVTGSFAGVLDFETTTISRITNVERTAGNRDGIYARFSPTGVLSGLIRIGGPGDDASMSVAPDATGGFVVAGNFTDRLDVPRSLNGLGQSAFVMRFDPNLISWALALPNHHAESVAIRDTDVFVAGDFSDRTSLVLDGTPTGFQSVGGSDALILKLSLEDGAVAEAWPVGSRGDDVARAVAVTSDGLYVSGSFAGPVGAPYDFTTAGGADAFVAKLDPDDGALIFARHMGGAGNDSARALATDLLGGVAVGGYFEGTLSYPASTTGLSSRGARDGFVLRLDKLGNLTDALSIGGPSDEVIQAIVLGPEQMQVSGSFSAGAVFDTSTQTLPSFASGPNQGATDAFVARFAVTKMTLPPFLKTLGSSTSTIHAVQGDPDGCMYVAGTFQGTVNFAFDSSTGSSPSTLTAEGPNYTDAFIAKYSPTLDLIYVSRLGSLSGDVVPNGLALLGAGRVALVGKLSGDATWQLAGLSPLAALHGNGGNDGFYIVFGPRGSIYGAQVIGGEGDDSVDAVAVDQAGMVYLGGTFQQSMRLKEDLAAVGGTDGFIAKLDPYLATWAVALGGTGNDRVVAIASNNSKLFAAGVFGSPFVLGSTSLTSGTGTSAFVVSYSITGTSPVLSWSTAAGTGGVSQASALAANSSVVAVAGTFSGTVNQPVTLTARGGSDAFAWLLDAGNGATIRTVGLGGESDDTGSTVAIGPNNSLTVGGAFRGEANFGGLLSQSLTAQGLVDGFIAHWLPDGGFTGATRYGGSGNDSVAGVYSLPANTLYVGSTAGTGFLGRE